MRNGDWGRAESERGRLANWYRRLEEAADELRRKEDAIRWQKGDEATPETPVPEPPTPAARPTAEAERRAPPTPRPSAGAEPSPALVARPAIAAEPPVAPPVRASAPLARPPRQPSARLLPPVAPPPARPEGAHSPLRQLAQSASDSAERRAPQALAPEDAETKDFQTGGMMTPAQPGRQRPPAALSRERVDPGAEALDPDLLEGLPVHIRSLLLEPERETAQRYYSKPFRETRAHLIQRLLDPPLTLEETARILNVCPMTVRRYTNRGVLPHFRTPGDQRRFRLSDVLTFMESQGRRTDTE